MLYPELLNGMPWDQFLQTLTIKANIKSNNFEISRNDLADLFFEVEHLDHNVKTVMLNAVDYSYVRLWGNSPNIETNEENLRQGIMASIWGADLQVHRAVPVHTIIALSEIEQPKNFIPRLAVIMQMKERFTS